MSQLGRNMGSCRTTEDQSDAGGYGSRPAALASVVRAITGPIREAPKGDEPRLDAGKAHSLRIYKCIKNSVRLALALE